MKTYVMICTPLRPQPGDPGWPTGYDAQTPSPGDATINCYALYMLTAPDEDA